VQRDSIRSESAPVATPSFRRFVSNVLSVFFYVATIASEYFKNRSSVARGMRVRSGWRHGRRLGRRGPTASALAHEPDTLGAYFLLVWAPSEG
jgi:hypothetical protein